ncbi:MAG: peptidoglycan DD-metalloendopeptidase family protein [Myxococcales bacterium]
MKRPAAFLLALFGLAIVGATDAAPSDPASPAVAVAALDRRVADIDVTERAYREELTTVSSQLGEVHARVLGRGRAFYRLTRAGLLPIGGGFDELVRHAMRVERTRRAIANDLDLEKRLRVRAVEVSQALERLARDRVALATQRSALDAQRVAYDADRRRHSAFDHAFDSSRGAGDYVAVYGGNGAFADPGTRGGFGAARGRLLFPVIGRAEVHPSRREGADGGGLELHAAVGTPVRATFAGRVAFADRYGPYGRIVILDHGDHYFTVSGNLGSIEIKIGEDVASGDRIGTVGDEGRGPMLYFEVRRGAQTIAAAPWLGL